MTNIKKIGFIGAGNMANAIISGLIRQNIVPPENIYVFDVSKEKCALLSEKGVSVCESNMDTVKRSDYTVIAVKPQNYPEVLSQIAGEEKTNKVFISIAAGISISYISERLGGKASVVRVMPNTPILLGKGATALSRSEDITDEDFAFVKKIFATGGIVEELPENLMNTVISVNGSSPAYVYLFAKAMIDYASENGIDRDKALNLVCASLEGSAAMLRESGEDPDTLIKKVCSPGGTTIEAINTFTEFSFYDIVKKAMQSCTKRAFELGK